MEKQNSTTLNSNSNKVKLMCSYGGKIHPRPSDHQLTYSGGDTKILALDRNVKLSEIVAKLNSLFNWADNSSSPEVSIKYQLPGEDLDALVSLVDDEDVEHMMAEHDRMQRVSSSAAAAAKPARLRLFVFDVSPVKSEPRPVKAGQQQQQQQQPANPDYLFGFDKEYQPSSTNLGPPLDLLQIPGVVLPDNCGGFSNVSAAAAGQAVYRVPVVGGGGVYQTGVQYVYGNRPEQPMYNFVPVIPPVPEPRMMVSTGNNSMDVKVNQRQL